MAYKIFISHVWRGQNVYYLGLLRLLAEAKRFNFHDLSIPKFRPLDGDYSAVRDDIFRALQCADVVLVINTPIITNSAAVQDELSEAERLGVPIVAVSPPKRHGERQSQCPAMQRVTHRARWTTKSIVDAVRAAIKERSKRRPIVDVAHDAYETAAAAAADVAQLSEAQVASVVEDDDPRQTGPVLSQDFTSLLTRSSDRPQIP